MEESKVKKVLDNLNKRQFLLLLADIFLIGFALLLSFLIHFEGSIPGVYIEEFHITASAFLLMFLISFKLFRLYNSLWSYASVDEVISLFLGVSLGTVLSGFLIFLFNMNVPRSIIVLMWFTVLIFSGGIRIGFRLLRRHYKSRLSSDSRRILIIGAGAAGSMVLKELKENQDKFNCVPVGFIDDDPAKRKMKIHGLPVLGNNMDLQQVIEDKNIDEVIIAIPSVYKKVTRRIVEICKKNKVKTKIIPGIYEIINGSLELQNIREVDIEDLLGREPVKVNINEMAGYLKDETILITGAGGSIGSELCRQIAGFEPKKILLLGRGENSIFDIDLELKSSKYNFDIIPIIADVKDKAALECIFKHYSPSVVFHAAAHKHVSLMESNNKEAVKNNIFGTKNVVEVADKFKARKCVLVSTDKAVNPTSVMGITKRIAEMVMQSAARNSPTEFCAVRFGNVLGSRGSVVPVFKKQIDQGGPLTVTHPEMTRYFMTIKEAVQLVIQAGAMGDKGEIFVLDMGEPVKILRMAEDLIKLSGFEPYKDIEVEFSGVRPGEKLYEELLTSEERVTATKNERIFMAKSDEINLQKFRKDFLHNIDMLLEETGSLKEKLSDIVTTNK